MNSLDCWRMTKFPLSGRTSPTYALFAKVYEVREPLCQAVEPQKAEDLAMASASAPQPPPPASPHPCKPDHMPRPLVVGPRAHLDLFHREPGFLQPPRERRIARRRPHREHPAGRQRGLGGPQAGERIDAPVLLVDQRVGAVVDVEQDRVVAPGG